MTDIAPKLTPNTRRSFLAAAVGGLAGLLAGRLAEPQVARADDGQAVIIGNELGQTAQSPTRLYRDDLAWNSRADLAGAQYGLRGSNDGTAAQGGGTGVVGEGTVGVRGQSIADNSVDGIGVHAVAISGGAALLAEAQTGIGVKAAAQVDGGAALVVDGLSIFLKRSGKVNIAAGASSRTVNAFPVYPESLVLANIQGHVPGLWITGVQPNVNNGRFTIHLNKPAPSTVKVGWFIVN
ncbi:MAG: hypothetical protein WEB00_14560 [Dehalococcoidia bacterium]